MYDIIIKNGRILDPGQNLDQKADVAISNGEIVQISPQINEPAVRTVNAEGCIVCPGLMDIHTHINYRGQDNGMAVDLGNIPYGVTYAVDAGSTGISSYRAFLLMLNSCDTRTKVFLNVSPTGLIMPSKVEEPVDPSLWDRASFDEAIREYGDAILGFKIRISKNIVKELGIAPLDATVELAQSYHKKVMIHATNPPIPMAEVVEHMRSGDIISHIYHGNGLHLFADGEMSERVREAQRRGICMDVSPGQGNFSIAVARRAIAEGFLPDTISTDMNRANWNHPMVFSLTAVMSKMMALGMQLPDVIQATTWNAAKAIGEEKRLGALLVGRSADITVLRQVNRPVTWFDKYGNIAQGTTVLSPVSTIVNGKLLYQSIETL